MPGPCLAATLAGFAPQDNAANLRKHRAHFADAATAFDDPLLRTTVDPDAQGERRYVSIGRDALGIVLVVVWTERGDVVRLISARNASPGEAKRPGDFNA